MSVRRQPNPMAGLPASPPLAVPVAGGQLESAEPRIPTTIGISAHQRGAATVC
jgi:hypothetical protein